MYEYLAVIKDVHDGDTVIMDIDQGFDNWHHNMHIRLVGINAPELSTPEGIVSRDFLKQQIPVGTVIMLRSLRDKSDKYGGRYDGTLLTGVWAKDGTFVTQVNLNDLMLSSGHAVPYAV